MGAGTQSGGGDTRGRWLDSRGMKKPDRLDSNPFAQGRRRALRVVWRLLLLGAGSLAFAWAVRALVVPNGLLSGGVAGLAILAHRLFGAPIGLAYAVLNIPIFILGARIVGRGFILGSGVAVVITWVVTDLTAIPPATNDPLLAGIFGGVLYGVGTALGLRAGASLGGFDILGVVVNRRFGLGVGEVLLVLNGFLILLTGSIESPEKAMYTLVLIFASGKTVDVLTAPRRRKAFLVMTRRPEPIRERVLRTMNRGVTLFRAEGGWSHTEVAALLCVVTRAEVRELSDLVHEEDPEAFIVVLESSEVQGAFRNPPAAAYWRRLQETGARKG